jgi:hypothetical protein
MIGGFEKSTLWDHILLGIVRPFRWLPFNMFTWSELNLQHLETSNGEQTTLL